MRFFFVGTLAGLAITACSSIEPVAPSAAPTTDPTQLYRRLKLDYAAVTLSAAPGYNTLQLTATPFNALGNAMVGLPAPTYRSLDTTGVRVTSAGVVTALRVGTEFEVVAELAAGPVRYADTARITVTSLAAPPVPVSLSIDPVSPDSAIWSVEAPRAELDFSRSILVAFGIVPRVVTVPQPRVVDQLGNEIPGLAFEYVSLDPTIAEVPRWNRISGVRRIRPGQARIVARATAYGVTKADTVTFTVTMPAYRDIRLLPGTAGVPVLSPAEIRVAPHGIIFVRSFAADSVDIVFDDDPHMIAPPPSVCSFLDIFVMVLGPGPTCTASDMMVPPSLPPDPLNGLDGSEISLQVRQFSVPGVYQFHSTRAGFSGRVIVAAGTADDPLPIE